MTYILLHRSIIVSFVLFISLFVTTGCTGEEATESPKETAPVEKTTKFAGNQPEGEPVSPEEADDAHPIKLRAVNERLVASHLTNHMPFWCGEGHKLVYVVKYEGTYLHDTDTDERKKLLEWPYDAPLGCTPDGEWLIFQDKGSVRWDKDTQEKTVIDVWRLEIETGKRQKFAVAKDPVYEKGLKNYFQPGDTRIYLRKQPNERIEMPEPQWEILWPKGRGQGRVWLRGKEAVVGNTSVTSHGMNIIEVETFGSKGKVFDVKPPYERFQFLTSDSLGRVYLRLNGRQVYYYEEASEYPRSKYVDHGLARCEIDIEDEEIDCERLLDSGERSFGKVEILSDAETIIYSVSWDTCEKVMLAGREDEARCLTPSKHTVTGYNEMPSNTPMELYTGNHSGISPDESLFFYQASVGDGTYHYGDDLYITELKTK